MGTDVETKVNYTVVGVFVLLLTAAFVAGILWLASGGNYRKVYDTYLAYMSESVSGLNFDAPVKYRGVAVGRVRRISLDQGERVRLELDIERGTPIKVNTVAVLRVQGLTGVAYVELEGGSRDAPMLTAKPGEEFPVIASTPSLLTRLDTAVTDLLTSLNRVSSNVSSVLDDENRRNFKHMLADMAVVSATVAARKDAIDASLQGAARTAENTAKASAELQRLIERLSASAQALEKMAKDVSRASASVTKVMDNADGGVSQIKNEAVPELDRTLSEVRELSASLKQLSTELGRNPNMLLLGKQPAAPGPGE
jgi:phospholipid/cholesterol/gamma-HCH transport system substrate-binding protein